MEGDGLGVVSQGAQAEEGGMSFGTQVGVGLMLVASGAAGYERYMLQGDIFSAHFDVAVLIAGVVFVSNALNRKFGP